MTRNATKGSPAGRRSRAASSRRCTAGRLWSIRQYAGLRHRRRVERTLPLPARSQGQPALSVAFDLPTQMGMDSDDPRRRGEIGQVGVAIDSLATWRRCSTASRSTEVSTSMTINAPAAVLVAMYVVARGTPGRATPAIVMGTAQNDVLKEYVARGTYIYPPRAVAAARRRPHHLLRRATRRSSTHLASGLPHPRRRLDRRAGDGFAFANAIAYVEACQRARRRRRRRRAADLVDLQHAQRTSSRRSPSTARCDACGRTSCATASARRIPRSLMLRTHMQTGGSTLTAQQPENNIVRAAIQALASVLGGVQSMALSCYDEALAIPTEKAQTHRGAHAADRRRRDGRHRHRRPARRLVPRRVAHRRARAPGAALLDEVDGRRRRRVHRVRLDPGAHPGRGVSRASARSPRATR